MKQSIETLARAARGAARTLAASPAATRDRALIAIAAEIETAAEAILAANDLDLAAARAAGRSEAILDRLRLDRQRLTDLAASVRAVAALPDATDEDLLARIAITAQSQLPKTRSNVSSSTPLGLALMPGCVCSQILANCCGRRPSSNC